MSEFFGDLLRKEKGAYNKFYVGLMFKKKFVRMTVLLGVGWVEPSANILGEGVETCEDGGKISQHIVTSFMDNHENYEGGSLNLFL